MKANNATTANRASGFTLIELMVTVSVLGILLALAAPSLRDFLVANRLSTNVNSLIGLFNYARSEAIARNQPVLVCARDAADGTCNVGQNWAEFELQVFVDVNGNNTFGPDDILLKTVTPVDTTATQMVMNRAANLPRFVGFNSNGMSQNNFKIDINAVGDVAHELRFGRTICVSRPGRARVVSWIGGAGNCPAG